MREFENELVLIIGAARQGTALARYILEHGGRVRLTDLQQISKLEQAKQALSQYTHTGKIEWVLGEHPFSLLDGTTLVCPSGGVPLDIPIIQEACKRGIPLSNDLQIFLENAPCKTIGITGSAGKTTTTVLVGRILQAWKDMVGGTPKAQVWVGGNIGSPLIAHVDEMQPNDLAVLELSSFQLDLMNISPNLACILNITPNHLDRHKNFEDYAKSKLRILMYQDGSETSILGRDDFTTWSYKEIVGGRRLSFGLTNLPENEEGTFLRDGWIWFREKVLERNQFIERKLLSEDAISLRGQHNRLNVMAACTICASLGASIESLNAGVEGFGGVPHRLEFVRRWGEADWYNDFIATAPERAIADILSFEEPLILLAGGRDKDLPWDKFADCVRERVACLILFGEAAELINKAVRLKTGDKPAIIVCLDLHEAVQQAAQIVQPGYVVLLAPGGTSFDGFKDFEERGRCFAHWVGELP